MRLCRRSSLSLDQTGRGLVLAAAVLWGTTGTAQALAPTGAEPMTVGALRLLVGGIALLSLAAVRGHLRGGRWPLAATALSALSVAGYQLCFFAAVSRTGVAIGTMVAIGSAPIVAGLLGWLVRGERPSGRWLLSTFLAVLGCGLLLTAAADLSLDTAGILLALGAGTAYAVYALTSKQLLDNQPPDAVTAVVFSLGALLLLPLLFRADLSWLSQPGGVAVTLHLGLVATALAYTLFARGLMRVPTATAVTLSLAEPLTAALLGVLLLGERLPPVAGIGVILLLSALAMLSVFQQA